MIRRLIIAFTALLLLLAPGAAKAAPVSVSSPRTSGERDFGVFVGLDPENRDRLEGYRTVVIDASGFTKAQIKNLHKKGQVVFSYLNIGSLERFRSYYKRFQDITLGEYEGWPGEYWIDVSKKEWQDYVVSVLAGKLKEKGVDGFFLDNADVYDAYPGKGLYEGLYSIAEGLKRYDLKIIMNGGQSFIEKADKEGTLDGLLYGANQESVFTDWNTEDGALGRQEASVCAAYKKYLAFLKKRGIRVFVTEYAGKNQKAVRKEIKRYCRKRGYSYYISPTRELI